MEKEFILLIPFTKTDVIPVSVKSIRCNLLIIIPKLFASLGGVFPTVS